MSSTAGLGAFENHRLKLAMKKTVSIECHEEGSIAGVSLAPVSLAADTVGLTIERPVRPAEHLSPELECGASLRQRASTICWLSTRERERGARIRERAARERERAARAHSAEAIDGAIEGFAVFDQDGNLVTQKSRDRQFKRLIDHVQTLGVPTDKIMTTLFEQGAPSGSAGLGESPARRAFDWHRGSRGSIKVESDSGKWIRIREHRAQNGSTVLVVVDTTRPKKLEKAHPEALGHLEKRVAERTAELHGAMLQAEQASRRKSQFLAQMSHELRTPLNAIIGFSEVIKDRLLGPAASPVYAEYASDIHNSGHHLLDLINDLLDLSKVEAEQFELSDDILDLSAIISDAVHTLESSALEKQISLAAEVESDLPRLRADRRATKQILLNLLSNAVKFTPALGTVQARACRRDRAIVVTVRDTGIGIDPRNLDRVLAPYGQGTNPEIANANGTGLGLPIAKLLIERHGGHLDLESEKGRGTTVSLHFPPERIISN